MSDLPILTALADVVSLIVDGRPTRSSSPSSSSSPASSGPRPGAVVPGAIIKQMQASGIRPQLKVLPIGLGPPGWLGAVVQYGQIMQSQQIDYLVTHTDPFWDAGGSRVKAVGGARPFIDLDDRTSVRILAVGHREPPCPWAPYEWMPSSAFTDPSVDRKGGQAHAMHGARRVSWDYRLKLWSDWWANHGHAEQRRGWEATRPATGSKVGPDAWQTLGFRGAIWMVWATECLRVKLEPGRAPTWWRDYANAWGVLVSRCTQERHWPDLPYTGREQWETVARRMVQMLGRPGERDVNNLKSPSRWPQELAAIGPLYNWSPAGHPWESSIVQAQELEYQNSKLGKFMAGYRAVINTVASMIATRAAGPVGGLAFTAMVEAVPTMIAAGAEGRWKDFGAVLIDQIEAYAATYISESDATRNLLGKMAGEAAGIIPPETYGTATMAAQRLNQVTQAYQDQWGWVQDAYGGGVAVTR